MDGGGMRSVLLIISVLAPWASLSAGPKAMEGLSIELVSERTVVRAGEPFRVGLFLDHAKGFHTYWKHPGIVGVPTGLVWELPEGFRAGSIEWPTPELTKMAVYDVYGYEGRTLLPVSITPPREIPGKKVTLKAKASWMCCAKTCHPGFTSLSIELPVATADEEPSFTEWKPEFARALKKQPIETEEWEAKAIREKGSVRLSVRPAKGSAKANEKVFAALADLYFFSGDGLIDSREPQSVQQTGDGAVQITLRVSEFAPEQKPEQKPMLEGVLRSKEPWIQGDTRTGLELRIPLTGVDAGGSRN